jgi:hypothetical protein
VAFGDLLDFVMLLPYFLWRGVSLHYQKDPKIWCHRGSCSKPSKDPKIKKLIPMKIKPFYAQKIQRSKEKANSHKDFAKVLIPMNGNFGTTHFGKVQLPLSLPFCATFTILHHIQQHTILPPWLAKAAQNGATLSAVMLYNPAL